MHGMAAFEPLGVYSHACVIWQQVGVVCGHLSSLPPGCVVVGRVLCVYGLVCAGGGQVCGHPFLPALHVMASDMAGLSLLFLF